jgi:hypothetical protein
MARIAVKVVIDAAHLGAQEAVVSAVAAIGLRVEQCIPEIGAIYGSGEDDGLVDRLRAVDGVLQAQAEAGVALPEDPSAPQ